MVAKSDVDRRTIQLRVESFNGKITNFNDDIAQMKD